MMADTNIGSLVHKVAAALDNGSDEVLSSRFDIGLSQFRILLILLENDGAKQITLADNLSQSEASISRQARVMEKKGLVIVRINLSSRREKLIFLTRKGALTARKAIVALNNYHAPLFDHLSARQQEDLMDTLTTILRYAEKKSRED